MSSRQVIHSKTSIYKYRHFLEVARIPVKENFREDSSQDKSPRGRTDTIPETSWKLKD